jgi:hypothetical protein
VRSRPLKVDDYNCLEGLSFAVADVGLIAPLLYGLHGGGCQGSVSFDQSQALNLAVLVNDLLEDYRSLALASRFDGKVGLDAVSQPLLGALGRENNRTVLPRQRGPEYNCCDGVLLAVARFGDLRLGDLGFGDDRCGCGGYRSWRRNFRAWGRYRLDRSCGG